MKTLLFLLAANLNASVYTPAEFASYSMNNVLTEGNAAYGSLTNNNSVAFVTTPMPPNQTYWASFPSTGSFSTPADFRTAFNGKTTWTVYFPAVNIPTLGGNSVLWSNNANQFLRTNANGSITFAIGTSFDSTSGSAQAGVNQLYAFRSTSGVGRKIYVASAGSTSWTEVGSSASDGGAWSSAGETIGNYVLSAIFPYLGYMGGIVYYDSALTAPPTVNSFLTPTPPLSPYIKNSNNLLIVPPRW